MVLPNGQRGPDSPDNARKLKYRLNWIGYYTFFLPPAGLRGIYNALYFLYQTQN
jgi:hypothetical protein